MDKLSSLGVEGLLRQRWDDQFASLAAFKARYGDCLVPSAHPTLGNWARIQCDNYRLYKQRLPSLLTKERFRLLKDLGFGKLVRREEAHEQKGAKESLGGRPKKKKGAESGKVSSIRTRSSTLHPAPRVGENRLLRQPGERDLVAKGSLEPQVGDRLKKRRSSRRSKSLPRIQENNVSREFQKEKPVGSFDDLLERKIKATSSSSSGSSRESSNGSDVPPKSLSLRPTEVGKEEKGDIHHETQRKKAMWESFQVRLKKKMELESAKGSAAPVDTGEINGRSLQTRKGTVTTKSSEDRPKKKLSDKCPEAPPVPSKEPSSSQKKSALDSFEDRLKKKLYDEHPEASPVPSKEPPSSQKKSALDSFEERLKRKLNDERPEAHPVPSKEPSSSQRKLALDSFESRLTEKLNGEHPEASPVRTKEQSSSRKKSALELFEDRLKKRLNCEHPEAPPVPSKEASYSQRKSAVDLFEDRLKKKLSNECPGGSPDPSKLSPLHSSVVSNVGTSDDLTLSEKVDPKIQSKRMRGAGEDEKPHSATDMYEKHMMQRLVKEVFGPSKSSKMLLADAVEEEKGGDGFLRGMVQNLPKNTSLMRSCSASNLKASLMRSFSASNLCPGSSFDDSPRTSLGPSQLFSEDDINVDYSESTSRVCNTAHPRRSFADNASRVCNTARPRRSSSPEPPEEVSDSFSVLKKSLVLLQLFSKDEVKIDYSEHTSWSELDGALAAAIKQSLGVTT